MRDCQSLLKGLIWSPTHPSLRRNAAHVLDPSSTPFLSTADASVDVKKAVVNALFLQNNASGLVTLARAEKSPELKKEIVSKLSIMKSKEATDYLMELLK